MTSEERRKARYYRRRARRKAHLRARNRKVGTLEQAFSYHDMFFYGRKCCNGVRWKQSTQNFELHLFSGTAKRRRRLLTGKWKPGRCVHFTLKERGKVRPIDAPHIADRQIHKVLSKKVLEPLYGPSMIYDNSASQKGKGLHFAFRRLENDLRWHYRHYGRQGGVCLLDLKGFFPNANRQILLERHRQLILEPRIRAVADVVVTNAPSVYPGRGMPLGVEPSQQEMVAMPSSIDNWIKCQRGVHIMGHYMDDYYIVLPDIEQLKAVGREIIRRFEAQGIPVNRKKCKIVPLTKPFRFCKAKFTLHENGKVTVNGNRDSAKRVRVKLRFFKREVEAGRRTMEEAPDFIQGQFAYYKNYDDHGRELRLRRYCYALFGGAVWLKSSKPPTEQASEWPRP